MVYVSIILLIIVTIIFGKIGVKLGFSEVVGQLLAGIVLGGSVFNIVQPTNLIHVISEIGILLLMLNSGMSSDIKEMKKYIKASVLIAVMGVLVPAIVFPIAFILLGYSIQVAIFSGVIFSATSISITLAVLAEQKKLATTMGAIILSAAVLDDIIALIAVILFSIFVGGGGLGINSLLPLVAFAIGILLRKVSFSQQLSSGFNMIGQWVFYPVFFGAIGLGLAVQNLNDKILPIIIFSLLAVITKFAGSFIGAKIAGLSQNIASAIGAGMISRGEMALVITQIGISSKIISEATSGEVIITVIISTIVAPILMKPLFSKV
ncbi:cation:proton antiporter [Leuconostoc carnosum]|uniref:cation:proton antiporter n=1 Tax=Leuconostoc carnosum TaxID=1252 RepID=UPI00123BD8BA|nr:cation:proton antiporter [Leuconostoc carnosum]KAA8358724.1 cation:proton antiporter [Leuconostoc carnosum]